VDVRVWYTGARKFTVGGKFSSTRPYRLHVCVIWTFCQTPKPCLRRRRLYVPYHAIQQGKEIPPANLWYRCTSGVQRLAAHWSGYEINPRPPTLILNQGRFKRLVVVEDLSTDELHIYQYPDGYKSGKARPNYTLILRKDCLARTPTFFAIYRLLKCQSDRVMRA
jgi:hypothetical protein